MDAFLRRVIAQREAEQARALNFLEESQTRRCLVCFEPLNARGNCPECPAPVQAVRAPPARPESLAAPPAPVRAPYVRLVCACGTWIRIEGSECARCRSLKIAADVRSRRARMLEIRRAAARAHHEEKKAERLERLARKAEQRGMQRVYRAAVLGGLAAQVRENEKQKQDREIREQAERHERKIEAHARAERRRIKKAQDKWDRYLESCARRNNTGHPG